MVDSTIQLDQLLPQPEEEPRHGGCGSCGTGKAGDGLSKCGNGLEKIYPTTAVRFGYLRFVGEFTHASDLKFTCGGRVVIQTRRGMEMGEQVSLTCGGCDKSVTRDQMRAWVDSCGEDSYMFDAGRILREATAADLAEYARIQTGNRDRRDFCRALSIRQGLNMKVVDCESLFGGERIIFYFMSEDRVDFREMVKELAREYRTRIEMRQVGARDEARLLADFETCGREVCCKVFLKTLRPISMRMAKLQKATLDPSQVSGRCGRLKCCLRYEHVGYEELDKKLPRTGIRVRTSHGDGLIVARQVLTQLVQIRKDDDTLMTVVAEDILETGVAAPPRPSPEQAGGDDRSARRPPRQSRDRRRDRTPGQGTPLRDRAEPPSDAPDAADVETPAEPASSEDVANTGNESTEPRRDSRPPRRTRGRRRGRQRGPRRGGEHEGDAGAPPAPPPA